MGEGGEISGGLVIEWGWNDWGWVWYDQECGMEVGRSKVGGIASGECGGLGYMGWMLVRVGVCEGGMIVSGCDISECGMGV